MYRRKVYGESWDGTTSPEDLETSHGAWDIRLAYNRLWNAYEVYIQDFDVDTKYWGEGMSPTQGVEYDLRLSKHDLVISSIPRTAWAEPGDTFEAQPIWALGDTEVQRIFYNRPDPFTVICNGHEETPWYRVSNMYGYATMEWPCHQWAAPNVMGWDMTGQPAAGASLVHKPLRHNSKAAADFVHVGRYGKWEKGVLSSDAFTDAMKAMANDSID